MQKISDKNCSSNEEQILKISNIVATGGMPKLKRKSNEEQFKVNSKVMLNLDEAEISIESSNTEKIKEKIVEGKPPAPKLLLSFTDKNEDSLHCIKWHFPR